MKPIGISFGWNCSSAVWAVHAGLRDTRSSGYRTCPFDEMLTNYAGVVECIRSDFEGFVDPANLVLRQIPTTSPYCTGDTLVYNTRYRFLFNHESPGHADLYLHQAWPGGKEHYIANNWHAFRERYSRRIENFRTYMRSGVPITCIITYPFPPTELEHALRTAYPTTQFKIIRRDIDKLDHYEAHMRLMEA
jgi:hypothetical protein